MKLNRIKATGMELTDAIRAAAEKVMANLDKYAERFGEAVSADIELMKTTQHHQKGPFYGAEINIAVPQKGLVRVVETDEDLYAAVDKMEESASRELRKLKERYVEHMQATGPEEVGTGEIAGALPVEDLEEEFREGPDNA